MALRSHAFVYTNVHVRTHMYTDLMAQEAQELSTRDVRANLADVINDAATRGRITFIMSRGRRVAAIVPVVVAEGALETGTPAS